MLTFLERHGKSVPSTLDETSKRVQVEWLGKKEEITGTEEMATERTRGKKESD